MMLRWWMGGKKKRRRPLAPVWIGQGMVCVLSELLGRSVHAIDRRIDRLTGQASKPSRFPPPPLLVARVGCCWPLAGPNGERWALGCQPRLACHRTQASQAGRSGVCIRAGRLVVGVNGRTDRLRPCQPRQQRDKAGSPPFFVVAVVGGRCSSAMERPTGESIHPIPMHAWPVFSKRWHTAHHALFWPIDWIEIGCSNHDPITQFFTDENPNPNLNTHHHITEASATCCYRIASHRTSLVSSRSRSED